MKHYSPKPGCIVLNTKKEIKPQKKREGIALNSRSRYDRPEQRKTTIEGLYLKSNAKVNPNHVTMMRQEEKKVN